MRFGEMIPGKAYRVVDENVMRLNAFFIFMIAAASFVIGFGLRKFELLPFFVGVVWLNFIIGLFVNMNHAPTIFISRLILGKKIKTPIGAIQKKFAWGLGLVLSSVILILSLFLVTNPGLFNLVCMLCLICLGITFSEAALKVCVGCELYRYAQEFNLISKPKPEEKPNCMGDSCNV
ncbi:DUF4395 domain-containing protein [Parvicella tangerina]|uniref:DUF4395 domain-containing protein n=1 Tax=Parvicella tangerina TaxID=2829795 RepID=A0A916NB01_9FLAO|nr:DUF4395 domain-containing protein [Parvicella tangerina]CAG5080110.1 hypothetical protein CRYO30217_01186 [Parvicella tangerina]